MPTWYEPARIPFELNRIGTACVLLCLSIGFSGHQISRRCNPLNDYKVSITNMLYVEHHPQRLIILRYCEISHSSRNLMGWVQTIAFISNWLWPNSIDICLIIATLVLNWGKNNKIFMFECLVRLDEWYKCKCILRIFSPTQKIEIIAFFSVFSHAAKKRTTIYLLLWNTFVCRFQIDFEGSVHVWATEFFFLAQSQTIPDDSIYSEDRFHVTRMKLYTV